MLDGRGLRLATDDGEPASAPRASGAFAGSLAEPSDPWRLFRLLRRQVWTLLGVIVAVNLLAALVLWQIAPIYKASALVLVDPRQQSVLDTDGPGGGRPADGARVESEVEILRSPSVQMAVVNTLDLVHDPEFAPRPGLPARLLGFTGLGAAALPDEQATRLTLKRLAASTTVTRRGATYVIEVAARSRDPEKAAQIANALAAAHIDTQLRSKVDFAADVQKRLAQQLESTRAALREIDRKLDSFLDDSIVEIEDPELRTELSDIRSAIREQAANRQRYDALAGRSRERARKREWDALIAELNSERMVRLNADAAAFRQRRGAGESADIEARLVQLDQQIDKEAQAVIARIAAEADIAQQNEAELRNQLSKRLAGADVPADIVLHFREVEGDAAALRLVVDKLTTHSTTATAEIDLQLPDSRIVSAALPPSTPAYPDTSLIGTLAMAFSILAGVSAAILRDNQRGGFTEAEALERFAGAPVLVALPAIENEPGRTGDRPADEILDRPDGAYAEAVRRLRLGLDLAPSPPRPQGVARVVLVTAAETGDGATQTAIALARSFALSGRKTLLIDGNLRQPGIQRTLEIERRQGPAGLAGPGAVPPDGVLFEDVTPLLAIASVPGDGRLRIDALMQSDRLGPWLQRMRQAFDIIVIDSPAVLAAIDTLLWIRQVDNVLMVVGTTTSPKVVRAALRAMALGGRGTAHLWLALNHKPHPRPNRRAGRPSGRRPGPALPPEGNIVRN